MPLDPPVPLDSPSDLAHNPLDAYLAWVDDQLAAGDEWVGCSTTHLSENLGQASLDELRQFEQSLKLLRWMHGRKTPATRPRSDRDGEFDAPALLVSLGRSTTPGGDAATVPRPLDAAGQTPGKPTEISQPRESHVNEPTDSRQLTVLGRFEIERLLGYGASGMVLLAWDPLLKRKVAIMAPQPLRSQSETLHGEFRREAVKIARLDNAGIVPIYDLKIDDRSPLIVMAYCEGGSLAEWLQTHPGRRPQHEAALLVAGLADALHYAHQRGIVHRDLNRGIFC